MSKGLPVVLALGATTLSGTALAAETLMTKIDGVEVLSKPKLGSERVSELQAGTELEGLAKRGLFWKVKTPDG